jgi:hypothetical protein
MALTEVARLSSQIQWNQEARGLAVTQTFPATVSAAMRRGVTAPGYGAADQASILSSDGAKGSSGSCAGETLIPFGTTTAAREYRSTKPGASPVGDSGLNVARTGSTSRPPYRTP